MVLPFCFEKVIGEFLFLAILGHFVLYLPRISTNTTKNSPKKKISHNFFQIASELKSKTTLFSPVLEAEEDRLHQI